MISIRQWVRIIILKTGSFFYGATARPNMRSGAAGLERQVLIDLLVASCALRSHRLDVVGKCTTASQ